MPEKNNKFPKHWLVTEEYKKFLLYLENLVQNKIKEERSVRETDNEKANIIYNKSLAIEELIEDLEQKRKGYINNPKNQKI